MKLTKLFENQLSNEDKKSRQKRERLGLYSSKRDSFEFIALINQWDLIVGPLLAKKTQPLRIYNDQLYILVGHPTFSHQLQFITTEIINKITTRFKSLEGSIKKIRFVYNESFFLTPKQSPVSLFDQLKSSHYQINTFSPEFRELRAEAKINLESTDDSEMDEILQSLYIQLKMRK